MDSEATCVTLDNLCKRASRNNLQSCSCAAKACHSFSKISSAVPPATLEVILKDRVIGGDRWVCSTWNIPPLRLYFTSMTVMGIHFLSD